MEPVEFEKTFAAAVLNARGRAKIVSTAGLPQSASEQVEMALIELGMACRDAGMSPTQSQTIADRYIEYDQNGKPWPRSAAANVTPFWR